MKHPEVSVPARNLSVAASGSVADLLSGRSVAGRVAGVGRAAAYVVPLTSSPRVVAVVASSATVPSCALVLPDGVAPDEVLSPGQRVLMGAGRLCARTSDLRVARWWTAPTVTAHALCPAAVDLLAGLLAAGPVAVEPSAVRGARHAARPAARALAEGNPVAAAGALTGVLGLGPGLTPSGDDVAAGVLLGARAAGVPDAVVGAVGASLLEVARRRTNAVSAGLLAEATAGRAADVVVRAVRSLQVGGGRPEPQLRALLALGSSSGTDLATGVLAAAREASGVAATTRRRSA